MARLRALTIALVFPAFACSRGDRAASAGDAASAQRADSLARARQDSVNRASSGYIVDSIFPVEEEIRRFRAAIGGSTMTRLGDASLTREALVARLAAAVTDNDDRALGQTVVTAREFIDLVYPESPHTRPPYRQAPGLVWTMIREPSESGRRRLLVRLGGQPLTVSRVSCDGTPEVQGRNRLWKECTVRYRSGNEMERDGRLFGTILERDGRFKFMSLANQY